MLVMTGNNRVLIGLFLFKMWSYLSGRATTWREEKVTVEATDRQVKVLEGG